MEQPRLGTERINSIDLIRGIAICGLAPINILDFASPDDYYLTPGDLRGSDLGLWVAVFIFGMGKFISLFSVLFGAGIVLQTQRSDLAGKDTARRYLPRLAWLFLFGMLHAYLIWYGDILVGYAITGFLVFWFRKWSAGRLLTVGGLIYVGYSLLLIAAITCLAIFVESDEFWNLLSESGAGDGEEWDPTDPTGTWLQQLPGRSLIALCVQIIAIPFLIIPINGGLMLIGMAALKSGFFEGSWKPSRYRLTLFLGLGLGLCLSAIGLILTAMGGWEFRTFTLHSGWLMAATPLLVCGYAAAAVLWSRASILGWLQNGFRALGRMAFTNYIGQSVIFHLLFYGTGFGLRGQLSFTMVMLVPLAVWVFQIIASTLWFRVFRFGPLEWIWRCLTYRTWLPIRILP
ncbi:MAG: DUF418 domain-containing protein [Verrucomicrobiota bacterium]